MENLNIINLNEKRWEKAIELLKAVCLIKKYQDVSSMANQGQCLDGYSALANYNGIVTAIEKFLEEEG